MQTVLLLTRFLDICKSCFVFFGNGVEPCDRAHLTMVLKRKSGGVSGGRPGAQRMAKGFPHGCFVLPGHAGSYHGLWHVAVGRVPAPGKIAHRLKNIKQWISTCILGQGMLDPVITSLFTTKHLPQGPPAPRAIAHALCTWLILTLFLAIFLAKIALELQYAQDMSYARLQLSLQLSISSTPPSRSSMTRSMSSALFPSVGKPLSFSRFFKATTWGNGKALAAFLMSP